MKGKVDKVSILFALLASGKYRVWWWANFGTKAAQVELRMAWESALKSLSPGDIRSGLKRWEAEKGDDLPPSAADFEAFCRPAHTPMTRRGFADIRAALEG